MKSFTAKQFVKAPAQVYEAAREEGAAEITHDRHPGKFVMTYNKKAPEGAESDTQDYSPNALPAH